MAEPELEMIIALFEEALHCYKNKKGAEQREAGRWIRDRDETNYPFTYSFNTICEYLDADPDIMRTEILNPNMEYNLRRTYRVDHRASIRQYGKK